MTQATHPGPWNSPNSDTLPASDWFQQSGRCKTSVAMTPRSIIIDGQQYVPQLPAVAGFSNPTHTTTEDRSLAPFHQEAQAVRPRQYKETNTRATQVWVLVGMEWNAKYFNMARDIFEDIRQHLPSHRSPLRPMLPKPHDIDDLMYETYTSGDPAHFDTVLRFYEAKAKNEGVLPQICDELYERCYQMSAFQGIYAEARKLGLNELNMRLREFLFESVDTPTALLNADAVYSLCPDDKDFRASFSERIVQRISTVAEVGNVVHLIEYHQLTNSALLIDLLSSALGKSIRATSAHNESDAEHNTGDEAFITKTATKSNGSECDASLESVDAVRSGAMFSGDQQDLAQSEINSHDLWGPTSTAAKSFSNWEEANAHDFSANKLELIVSKLENINSRVDSLTSRMDRLAIKQPRSPSFEDYIFPRPALDTPPPPPPPNAWGNWR